MEYHASINTEPTKNAKLVVCESTGGKLEALDLKVENLRDGVVRLRRSMERHQNFIEQGRLYSYGANILTQCLKKLNTPEEESLKTGQNDPAHSTTRYANTALQIEETSFMRETNLPSACFRLIRKYSQVNSPSMLGVGFLRVFQ